MGKFKNGILTALVLVVATGAGAPVWAESGHKGHGGSSHEMHAHGWKATLTDEQRKQIDKLHLTHKGQMYLLKTRIRQAKIELAMLVSNDKPDTTAIEGKIGELAELQREKMKEKTTHQIEVRKLLNEDQKMGFDMHLLQKASKGRHGHHGK